MALDATTAVTIGEQGETCMRPSIINRFTLDGDAAYVTGGSAGFEAIVRTIVGQRVTINAVVGHGYTAGDWTHIVRYNRTADTLLVYVLATGAQAANAADLSAVEFDITVFSE